MPISVYIHVPFCLSRCDYCAFYSGESLGHLRQYPDWLAAEVLLRSRSDPTCTGAVSTVYFGGGTPSLLGSSGVARVLEAVDRAWGIAEGAEVSLETNPAAGLDLPAYRAAGVTRLSIGVQCLEDDTLRALGRTHTAALAGCSVAEAMRTGFATVSADLLFGIPGLTQAALRRTVRALVEFGVHHISTYCLEIHAETPLDVRWRAGAYVPVSAEEEEAQWTALDEELAAHGFGSYEVSNYCLPGHRCRHNQAYWTGAPYVGLGPGAHSFQPTAGPWGARSWNAPELNGYADSLISGTLPPGGREVLSLTDSLCETLFLCLRRPDPIHTSTLRTRYGLDPAILHTRLEQATSAGLLHRDILSGTFTPSRYGLRTADGLALWLLQLLTAPIRSLQSPSSVDQQHPRRR